MGFLSGKKILITGLASNLSIAYGIAQAMHREGAELAFTYQNDKLKPRVEKMGAEFGSSIFLPCDVASEADWTALSMPSPSRPETPSKAASWTAAPAKTSPSRMTSAPTASPP